MEGLRSGISEEGIDWRERASKKERRLRDTAEASDQPYPCVQENRRKNGMKILKISFFSPRNREPNFVLVKEQSRLGIRTYLFSQMTMN